MSNRERVQKLNSLQDLGSALGYSAEQGSGRQQRPNPPKGRPNPWAGYLQGGYFVTGQDEEPYLRVELLTEVAREVANTLSPRMNVHQVRRFFTHIRLLENRLRNGATFDSIRPDLARLEPAAANAVARGLAPTEFGQFIERNAREAQRGVEHFRKGFVPHFEAVVAYLPRDRR